MSTTTTVDLPAIPASLDRKTNGVAALKASAAKIAAKHNLTKKAKPVAAAPKAEAKPPAHKKSNIARTEGNLAKSIVPVRFKQAYAAHNDTNGDRVGLTLKEYTTTKNADGRDALNVDLLKQVAKDNGIDFSPYEGLNNGQKRMSVGNKLRGLLKAGKTVQIGKQRFADAAKALAKEQAAA